MCSIGGLGQYPTFKSMMWYESLFSQYQLNTLWEICSVFSSFYMINILFVNLFKLQLHVVWLVKRFNVAVLSWLIACYMFLWPKGHILRYVLWSMPCLIPLYIGESHSIFSHITFSVSPLVPLFIIPSLMIPFFAVFWQVGKCLTDQPPLVLGVR
jgi:hypothetical protein